jgi:hypothetical protein
VAARRRIRHPAMAVVDAGAIRRQQALALPRSRYGGRNHLRRCHRRPDLPRRSHERIEPGSSECHRDCRQRSVFADRLRDGDLCRANRWSQPEGGLQQPDIGRKSARAVQIGSAGTQRGLGAALELQFQALNAVRIDRGGAAMPPYREIQTALIGLLTPHSEAGGGPTLV